MKIESFSDLVKLAYQFHNLSTASTEELQYTNYKSLNNNPRIINILYNQLNEIQKKCLMFIHSDISSKPFSITLLDSRPGTGKSHLMATFGMTCKYNILFVVYKKELVDYMNQIPYWDCVTAAKFKIKLFNLTSYKIYFSKFETKKPSIEDIIGRIFVLTKMINKEFVDNYDIFIIDEYTVLNPEMVLAFCFMAMVHKKHVMFSGDKCQQNSIDKSSQSANVSNYYFLNAIASRMISLTRSVRCTDDSYNEKLDAFRSIIETSGHGSTPMNFFYGYKLYELFRENFYNPHVFEKGCYFAIHHKLLTSYTIKFKQHLIDSQIKFGVAEIQNEANVPIPEHDEKFFYSLILIPGMMYVYNKKRDPKIAYGQYRLCSYSNDSIIIQQMSTLKRYTVNRTRLVVYNVLDVLYDRLCLKYKGPFYQFPLTPLYTSTYHNAQGLTISCNIDLNLSRATCESVYVGLSRIKAKKQLNRLEYDDRHLKSFEYTYQQNDEYAYFINNSNDVLDFKEVLTPPHFYATQSKKNLKIKKYLLNLDTSNVKIPPLVQAAEFIKNNVDWCLNKYQTFELPQNTDNLKSNLGHLL